MLKWNVWKIYLFKTDMFLFRYLAISHPVFFQSVRSRTSPWFEVLIAVLSGMIIQVPHMIRTQVTDPSCWTPHQDIPNTINLTVFCPCNFDGNDVIPFCVESNDYFVLNPNLRI